MVIGNLESEKEVISEEINQLDTYTEIEDLQDSDFCSNSRMARHIIQKL
jgi:hypothetical protein